MDKDFLLEGYGLSYGPEAGPWNLSKVNLYIEYLFRKFFEDNFNVKPGCCICNVGIGAGEWDKYLSYYLADSGKLTSIDIDSEICRQLSERLENEKNPYKIEVINKDVNLVTDKNGYFDIVTIMGSTRRESGEYDKTLESCVKMLKKGGQLFYSTLEKDETMDDFIQFSIKNNIKIENYLYETIDNYAIRFWKATKR